MARPVLDDDPGPGPNEPPQPDELTGAIGDYYRKLGGATWGRPLGFPQKEGSGLFVSFAAPGQRLFVKAIVWSPRTGAHVMGKRIFEPWLHGGSDVVGFPTSDPMKTHDNAGSWQTFENGIYVWHPNTGAHEVHGAILARYGKLGGSVWGYPTTDETATPDKRGRFNDFLNPATGEEKSIYWTPQTGAHEIFGYIRRAWAAGKWERGPVGYPTSGEMATHDKVGRWQTFEKGIYVWHPDTGAHEVHGAILERYTKLGGSAWGYPTTDEGDAKGPGRFNHFVELPVGHHKSIHWSPQTGAVEVIGYIRRKWEEMNWEHGYLGYPVSPETNWPGGGAGARQQKFQGGSLLWRPNGPAMPDPIVFRDDLNGTGVRGEAVVSVYANDTAHYTGHVKTTGADGKDYIVHVLLRSPNNTAIAFTETGSISGDLSLKGDERDDFDQSSKTALPAGSFLQFQNATLEVDTTYRSHISGAFGDILETALKWFAGTALIATPGTALILLGGTTAVTGLAGGSLASGMRIVSGTLWLAGPFGTAIAVAADALARLATDERPLSEEEYALADLVYKGTLPARTDIVVSDAIGGGGRPFTYPRFDGKMVISVGDKHFDDIRWWGTDDPDPKKRKVFGELLIHELVHVWQYHWNAANISYVADAIWARVRDDYDPGKVLDEPWDSFGLEEQGSIVDTWFTTFYNGPGSATGTGTEADDYGLNSAAGTGNQAFKFIRDHIRKGWN